MRLLLVHRHYHPDTTTYAHMLRLMAEHFVTEGHDVSVLTGPPSFNATARAMTAPRVETVSGVKVRRCRLPRQSRNGRLMRLADATLFWLDVVIHIVSRRRRFDVLVVTTMPPVIMGLAALLGTRIRGGRFIYHCMDLYPEIAVQSGLLKNRRTERIAESLDRHVGQCADAVVVLSSDMRSALSDRGQRIDNVIVLNNFAIDEAERPSRGTIELPGANSNHRIIYAGNLGRFQGLDHLVLAVSEMPNTELVLVGEGKAENELRDLCHELIPDRSHFVPFQPVDIARDLVAQADVAIVSLLPGVIRFAYPSKLITYLRAGTPVVALVETDSELAQTLQREGVGLATASAPSEVGEAISTVLRRPPTRAHVQSVADRLYGRREVLDRWSSLLREMDGPRTGSAKVSAHGISPSRVT